MASDPRMVTEVAIHNLGKSITARRANVVAQSDQLGEGAKAPVVTSLIAVPMTKRPISVIKPKG